MTAHRLRRVEALAATRMLLDAVTMYEDWRDYANEETRRELRARIIECATRLRTVLDAGERP